MYLLWGPSDTPSELVMEIFFFIIIIFYFMPELSYSFFLVLSFGKHIHFQNCVGVLRPLMCLQYKTILGHISLPQTKITHKTNRRLQQYINYCYQAQNKRKDIYKFCDLLVFFFWFTFCLF